MFINNVCFYKSIPKSYVCPFLYHRSNFLSCKSIFASDAETNSISYNNRFIVIVLKIYIVFFVFVFTLSHHLHFYVQLIKKKVIWTRAAENKREWLAMNDSFNRRYIYSSIYIYLNISTKYRFIKETCRKYNTFQQWKTIWTVFSTYSFNMLQSFILFFKKKTFSYFK